MIITQKPEQILFTFTLYSDVNDSVLKDQFRKFWPS